MADLETGQAGQVFTVSTPVADTVRLRVRTSSQATELDMPASSAVWLAHELLTAAGWPRLRALLGADTTTEETP